MSSKKNIAIVSPRAPSGATLLANILIELGVRPIWISDGNILRETADGVEYWRCKRWPEWAAQYNATRDGAMFRVRDCGQLSTPLHVLPFHPTDPNTMFVLVARDPRDALWSQFMRATKGAPQHGNRVGQLKLFAEYISWPDANMPTSVKNEPLYFYLIWKSFQRRHPVYICRFEDLRAVDSDIVNICRMLGFEPTTEEIATARTNSSVSKADAQATAAGYFRSGQAFEWHGHFTAAMHDMIGSIYDPICQWLGYDIYAKARALTTSKVSMDEVMAGAERYLGAYASRHNLPWAVTPKDIANAIDEIVGTPDFT